MRLTHQKENEKYIKEPELKTDDLINKLGLLEDIEEELGISLSILFKALKDGIWTKGGFCSDMLEEEPVFVENPEIGYRDFYDEKDKEYSVLVHDEDVLCIYTHHCDFTVRQTRIKDYGKTWALTKEEII